MNSKLPKSIEDHIAYKTGMSKFKRFSANIILILFGIGLIFLANVYINNWYVKNIMLAYCLATTVFYIFMVLRRKSNLFHLFLEDAVIDALFCIIALYTCISALMSLNLIYFGRVAIVILYLGIIFLWTLHSQKKAYKSLDAEIKKSSNSVLGYGLFTLLGMSIAKYSLNFFSETIQTIIIVIALNIFVFIFIEVACKEVLYYLYLRKSDPNGCQSR